MSVDFVAVGHVTVDRTPSGNRPGGAAYYAALTARQLGLRAGVLTSFGPDFPAGALPADVDVVNVASDRTTVFEVTGGAEGRRLALIARAADLEVDAMPEEWRRAPLAMLCPIINEVDPAFSTAFADVSLAVAPQGWMRARGVGGAISPEPWADADLVLPDTQVLVASAEDIEAFEKDAVEWFQQVPVGAITRGRAGATLFVNGEPYHVEPDRAAEVDPTGAGDVFTAALLVEYHREGTPWDAAAAAACCAAASVEAEGAAGIPDRAALAERLAAYRRRLGA